MHAREPTSSSSPAPWQLPPGVTRGLWDYTHADHIATEYDEYFEHNQLFRFDAEVLDRYLVKPGVVVDLGCGTGRSTLPLAKRGFPVIAVDLSQPMLQTVGEKFAAHALPVDRVLANLTQLDCLADGIADYAICMYSTLGMIRGRENRQRVVEHAFRLLKPGGTLVLHVHNFWYNLREPLSRRWFFESVWQSVARRSEAGDRFFDYRRIPKMFLHVFTRSELLGSLRQAGFDVQRLIHLDTTRQRELRWPWLLGRFRANGWISISRRP